MRMNFLYENKYKIAKLVLILPHPVVIPNYYDKHFISRLKSKQKYLTTICLKNIKGKEIFK